MTYGDQHERRPVGFGCAGSVSPACSSSSRRSPPPSATSRWRPRPRRRPRRRRRPSARPSPASPRATAAWPPQSSTVVRWARPTVPSPTARRSSTTTIPGVANLDPALLGALRRAATDAAGDGVEFVVDSGWRSPEYQEQLLREAVSKYGSEEEAARWVATPRRLLTCRGTRSTSGPAMPRRGCPSTAPSTGCARSTATSPGTTSCAPKPSITVARPRTPTRRTIHGCRLRSSN